MIYYHIRGLSALYTPMFNNPEKKINYRKTPATATHRTAMGSAQNVVLRDQDHCREILQTKSMIIPKDGSMVVSQMVTLQTDSTATLHIGSLVILQVDNIVISQDHCTVSLQGHYSTKFTAC